MRRSCIIPLASPRSAGSRSMARFSLVIIAETGVRSSVAKRMSRLVTMPTTTPGGVHHREAGDAVALLQRLGVGERLVGRSVTGA